MTSFPPRLAPAIALIMSAALAACASDAAATPVPSTPAPTPFATPAPVSSPAPEPGAGPLSREAYQLAICPVFRDILEVDPRISALRSAGADGEAIEPYSDELDSVNAVLLGALTDLEGVPRWAPGRDLRFHLIQSLHAMHAQLLRVARDPQADSAADDLAAVPFGSNDTIEEAMAQAVASGLRCPPADQ